MTFKNIINGVYRETAPDAESGLPAATPAEPEASTDQDVTPPDEGQDVIPEEANLWDSLTTQLDEEEPDDLPEDSPEVPLDEPESEPEPEPETPAEPEATPETETPAEPVAADTAVPTAEPEVQPTPEVQPEPIPQQTAEELQQARDARTAQIEAGLTDRFALSETEALQLVTDPQKAFPKLQARMFTDMWQAVEAMIEQRLPTVIENTTRTMKVRDEKVNDFFEAWPQLDRKKHGAQVAQVAQVFAQVNKGATEAEVIQNVGMQVMMMNGITPVAVEGDANPDTPAETPVTPHRPSAVKSAPRAPKQSSGNIWADMSIELEEDED